MLLDLDQGSMTVWKNDDVIRKNDDVIRKNDEKLRVLVAEGLSGPLCWAVVLGSQGEVLGSGYSVADRVSLRWVQDSSARIESAPAPTSPTEEELAAAKAWQAAH